MQVPGSADSASRGQSGSDLNFVKPKEEFDDSKLDMKIRCLCGSSLASESMIKVYSPFFGVCMIKCHVHLFLPLISNFSLFLTISCAA